GRIRAYSVSPKMKLSGDSLYAFSGFFDVGIRIHGFAQGVADALEVWQAVQTRETRQILVLPDQQLQPVPPAPDINPAQIQRVQDRLDTIIDSAVNTLPLLERVWVKAMLEWQIKLFVGNFLRSLQ